MNVFLCEMIHPAAVRLLEENGTILRTWEEAASADAMITRTLPVGRAEMDKMPHLKVIAVHGTGTDGIDLEEAKARGIRVVTAPHLNANAVAELAVGLALSILRGLARARDVIDEENRAEGRTAAEKTASAQRALPGFELRGRTAGFAGFGAIGSRISEILGRGFGMECLAWSPTLTKERAEDSFARPAQSLDDVFRSADIVFLTAPLTDETYHLADASRLASMKKGAALVNVSRGGLIDEEALLKELKSGHLLGAASDMVKGEFPEAGSPLLSLSNFIATPHIGANTDEALYAVGMRCATQILDILAGH